MLGEKVFIDTGDGRQEVPLPDDLHNEDAIPPDKTLMNTAYDMMHASGSDLAPYTKLYKSFHAAIMDAPEPTPVRPATFADGVAMQRVLDAVRESSQKELDRPDGLALSMAGLHSGWLPDFFKETALGYLRADS